MYAPRLQPFPAPVLLRLIGLLDEGCVAAFAALERDLGAGGRTVIVDVRDLTLLGHDVLTAFSRAIATARAEGRDIRLDAPTLPWKRIARRDLAAQPPLDPPLRAAVRRTVILAHSGKRRRR